jgi:hypothetical protein
MTAGLVGPLFFVGIMFVWIAAPFGPLDLDAMTVLGCIVILLMSFSLLISRGVQCEVRINRPVILRRWMLAAMIATSIWLAYILREFGWSPAVYQIAGQLPPDVILQGAYREKLPLKNLFPPLVMIVLVCALLLFRVRRNWCFTISTLVFAVGFVGIYETRHVLVWAALYYLNSEFLHVQQLLTFLTRIRPKRFLFLAWAGGSLLAVFVYLGNIRSGVSYEQAESFAVANAIESPFTRLPMPAVWALLYGFGAFARGIANGPMVPMINFQPSVKMVPGVLQEHVTYLQQCLHIDPVPLSPRYAEQCFAIDSWHTYCLQFGVIGAILLYGLIFFLAQIAVTWVVAAAAHNRSLCSLKTAFLFWILVRVLLLAVGDYFLDAGAFFEFFCLAFFFWVGGIVLVPSVRTCHNST